MDRDGEIPPERKADDRSPTAAHIDGRELPDEDVLVPVVSQSHFAVRLAFLVVGLGLFVTALGLMRVGAAGLAPALRGSAFTDHPFSTLGLGWLGACLVMSGSPVAASALALFDGGVIDARSSLTMLIGSRLGAAFVVLVVGVLYALRPQKAGGRRAPISIGILSLLMTFLVYLPSGVAAFALLETGVLDRWELGGSGPLTSATGTLFGWAVDLAENVLPAWGLFPAGVALLLVGFKLFDQVMPSVGNERLENRPADWREAKWPMFLVGCGVTLLTLSVAVSLTLLVPLVAKGHLRRANTLPYIAGANVTTLVDTLLAAVVLGNADAVRIVLAVSSAVTIWTVVLLLFAYPLVRRVCLGVARRALLSPSRLAVFSAVLLGVPVVLISI